MADSSEFDSICPYNDAEAVEALNKVANHPAVLAISEYLFPDEPITFLRNALKS
ncbi:MAG TPA: glycerol acyltransferase, partial [Rikenellaceae bacterium]|nr:glycerol acyltransferase [Rikenellaceae bacterium]